MFWVFAVVDAVQCRVDLNCCGNSSMRTEFMVVGIFIMYFDVICGELITILMFLMFTHFIVVQLSSHVQPHHNPTPFLRYTTIEFATKPCTHTNIT